MNRPRSIELAISNAIITETIRVLHHKFRWNAEDFNDAVQQILGFTKYVHADYTVDEVPTDPDDNRVLECALKADSDTIVTGDSDLLTLGGFRGIKIQSPSEFLVEFARKE